MKVSRRSVASLKQISLSNIGVIGYHLAEPLQVELAFEDEIYVAVSCDLTMHGYADTEKEALQDFCEALVEYYETLVDEQQNLGKVPKADFAYLDRILHKNIVCS